MSARRKSVAVQVALALAALLLPLVLLRDLSLSRATDLIRDLGPTVLLIPLPFALSLLVDTISWRALFASLGRRLSLFRLLAVRVSTEAVLAGVVGGAIIGEGAAPALLHRQGVPVGETVATCVVRKALHLLAQATSLVLAGLLAIVFAGAGALGSAAVASGAVIGAVALLWLRAMKSGSFAARLQRVLARILPARWIRPVGALTENADRGLEQTLGAPLIRTFVGFLAVWLLEVSETWLILRLLGAEVSLVEVWAFEPLAADPAVVDRVLSHFLDEPSSYDYVSNLHPATWPDGYDVEVMTREALEIAASEARLPHQREHTTPFLWDQPERFRIGNVAWHRDLSMTHRLTIDYAEDYQLIKAVFEALHSPDRPPFSLSAILDYLDTHPDVFALNQKYAGVNWYRHHLDELKTVDVSRTRWPKSELQT